MKIQFTLQEDNHNSNFICKITSLDRKKKNHSKWIKNNWFQKNHENYEHKLKDYHDNTEWKNNSFKNLITQNANFK